MSEEARFERSEIVTDWFGYWPSLHDAEVLSADFQRAIGGSGPGLSVKVHAFEMTSEVNEKGYFKLIKHCIIELRFDVYDIGPNAEHGLPRQSLAPARYQRRWGERKDSICQAPQRGATAESAANTRPEALRRRR